MGTDAGDTEAGDEVVIDGCTNIDSPAYGRWAMEGIYEALDWIGGWTDQKSSGTSACPEFIAEKNPVSSETV